MPRPRPRAFAGLVAVVALGILAGDRGRIDHETARPAASVVRAADPLLAAASTRYRDYVIAEVAALQTTTRSFTDAVRANDVAQAKARYIPARTHYAHIASAVESLGEFGDDIDPGAGDVADPARWIGFHRIEKALWADGSLAGMAPYANELDLDVFALKARTARSAFTPAEVATQACDLLTEISTTTVAGEKERYSHTDLWDVAAGMAGANEAFAALRPALAVRDPVLVTQIEARFADVAAWLDRYRQGAGYVDWTAVPQPQLRALSVAVDALAEPMSQMAATLRAPGT
jgi:iron uptake system component EfeO